jgi:hypothetical protein
MWILRWYIKPTYTINELLSYLYLMAYTKSYPIRPTSLAGPFIPLATYWCALYVGRIQASITLRHNKLRPFKGKCAACDVTHFHYRRIVVTPSGLHAAALDALFDLFMLYGRRILRPTFSRKGGFRRFGACCPILLTPVPPTLWGLAVCPSV